MQISGVNTPTGADARQPDGGLVPAGRDEVTGHGVPDLFSDVLRTLTALDDSSVTHAFEDSSVDMPDASRKPDNEDDTRDDVHLETPPRRGEHEISQRDGKPTEPFTSVTRDDPPETTEAPRPEAINRHVTIHFGNAADGKSPADHKTVPIGGQFTGTSNHQPRDPGVDGPAPRPINTPGASHKPDNEDDTHDDDHLDIQRHPGEHEISQRDGKPAEPFTSVIRDAPPETTEAPRPEAINRHVTIHFGNAADGKSPADHKTVPIGGQFTGASEPQPRDPGVDGPTPRPLRRLTPPDPGKMRPERDTLAKAPRRNMVLPSDNTAPPLQNTPEPTDEMSHTPVVAAPARHSSTESLAAPVSKMRAAYRFPSFLQPDATPPNMPEYGGSSQPDYINAAPDLVPADRSAGHSIPRHGTDPLLARMPANPTVATRTVQGARTPMTDMVFRSDAPPARPRTLPPAHDTKAAPSVEPEDARQSAEPETRRAVPRRTASEIGPAEAPAQGKVVDTVAPGIDRGHAEKQSVYRNLLPVERHTQQAMHNGSVVANTAQPGESNQFRPTENPLPPREAGRVFHPSGARFDQPRKPIPVRNTTRANDPLSLDKGDGETRMTQPRIRASALPYGHRPHGRWHQQTVNGAEPPPARRPTQAQIPPVTTLTLPKPANVATPAPKIPKLPRPSVNDPALTVVAAGSQPTVDPASPGVATHQSASQAPPLAISLTSPGVSHTASAVFAVRAADVLGQNHDRKIDISLHPKELGHVRMSMAMSDNGVTVTIAADRSETLDLMRRHIDNLSTALQSLGHHHVAFHFSDSGNRQPQTGDTATPEPRLPDEPGPEPAPGKTVQKNQTHDLDLRL